MAGRLDWKKLQRALPSAAIAAFVVVLGFRAVVGPLKFTIASLQLEGASGPVVLWVLCFLSITVGIWLLWRLPA